MFIFHFMNSINEESEIFLINPKLQYQYNDPFSITNIDLPPDANKDLY